MNTTHGLVLILEGPLQSWGTQGRFGHRDTDREPSKSGVLGLVAAALGIHRGDDAALAKLTRLSMAVRVDREGTVLRDYHTVGAGTYRGRPHSVFGTDATIVTTRYYLTDACFVVALSSDDRELVEEVCRALVHPRWLLFLGRKSCVPSRPVFFAGPLTDSAGALLRSVPWQGLEGTTAPNSLRCIIEDPSGHPRPDLPRSFDTYARRFDNRFVREEWIESSILPGDEHAPDKTAAESALG